VTDIVPPTLDRDVEIRVIYHPDPPLGPAPAQLPPGAAIAADPASPAAAPTTAPVRPPQAPRGGQRR
jgi:hypothetical protein